MKQLRYGLIFLLIAGLCCWTGCGNEEEHTGSSKNLQGTTLSIISGSENKSLEPLIQSFARREGVRINLTYQGSVDMTLMLSEQGQQIPYDAVWPANSLWLMLGDRHNVIKHAESIMRSPVVLGIKRSLVENLGWKDKNITVADILQATETGKFGFAMTSATQSNSGASAFLGFLHALSGSPDVLKLDNLENPQTRASVKRLLARIDRSSGSSGWLKETLLRHPERFQAMFNYESMIIEANRELIQRGKEPLYAVYPVDGLMISDSPLGYVDKGNTAKENLFKKLQEYLLSRKVQDTLLASGRRTALTGMQPENIDRKVFNPEWGIDVKRIISPIPTPSEPVIRRALELYQTALRKPSCTAYVLDVSGSMQGKGLADLKHAMTTLLEPEQARRYMLQSSPDDIHLIIPFNHLPQNGIKATGNSPETLNGLLNFVNGLQAGGGTDIYLAAVKALEMMGKIDVLENYFPAVILLTDGKSSGDIQALRQAQDRVMGARDIPIHAITFGNADERQLKMISEMTIGRVFHGKNLVKAFRKAKGYN